MKSYKYWAEDEIDKILREYKEKDTEVLAKELGRSKGSIATKYYDTIKQRGIELKKKQKITNKNYRKVNKCPICGGKRINQVSTIVGTNCITVNYCLSCFHEFTGDGHVLVPLWE